MTGARDRDPDPLNGVRPGGRRSFWLREALADEGPELAADVAAAPLAGRVQTDVAILGGGYSGLWTALRIRELEPAARVTIVEQDLCGGGPSGRNGGFVSGWWDELPALTRQFGEAEALRTVRALDAAIASLGPWCAAHGVDAELVERGSLQVSAAPSQDDAWVEATAACARVGEGERWRAQTVDDVAARVRSPVFRGGAFMPGAATVQPARLARGLRRVALEQGITIHERTTATLPGDAPRRHGGWGRGPVEIVTTSAEGAGVVSAEQVVVATNAWAAGWAPVARRLLTWSSYIVLTEPIPDRLAEIGWTDGEGLSDSRFTLHYARTTADGRIAIGGGGGRAGWGGRIGRAFTHDEASARRAADGLRRWFPSLSDVRIDDAWGGPIDISDDHRPWFATRPGGRVHHGLGYSGNGVGPAILGGRILAALATGRAGDDEAASLPIAGAGATPRAFPPEPFRGAGARVFRAAMVRREEAEEAGREPTRAIRQITRVPRRLGYHLGPK
ncbi:MAG: FAD-dependent oxidoreductase [Candidatus Limnocylindrales bacterium]